MKEKTRIFSMVNLDLVGSTCSTWDLLIDSGPTITAYHEAPNPTSPP